MIKISYIDKCKDCKLCTTMTLFNGFSITYFRNSLYCYFNPEGRLIDIDGNKTIPEWCELPGLTLNEAFDKWIAIKYPQHAEEIKSNPELLYKILEEK